MSRQKPSRFDFENITEVFKNSYAPYNGIDQIVGTTYFVLVETIVETIVRRLVSKRIPMTDVASALMLGKAFEGMFYFGEDPEEPGEQKIQDAALSGAQTAPGQFVGQYLLSIFQKGFTMPSFDLVDMLVTVGSKTISRPVVGWLDGLMPKDLKSKVDLLNHLLRAQRRNGLKDLFDSEKV